MLNNWAQRIDQAIASGGLIFYCQPIHRVGSDRPALYEVLMRIKESGAIIPAGAFVDFASEDQLVQIDLMAIDFALHHLQSSDTIHAINLSAGTLNDVSFPALMSKLLDKSGINPRLLWIEVIEQTALSLPSVQVLAGLRELRLLVGLDDFGARAATIAAFLEIGPDFLKVDGAIVRGIVQEHWCECVVFGAMAIADRRDIPLVLEHVESGAIETRILTLARHFPNLQLLLQGYLYGKPEPCPK